MISSRGNTAYEDVQKDMGNPMVSHVAGMVLRSVLYRPDINSRLRVACNFTETAREDLTVRASVATGQRFTYNSPPMCVFSS